MEKLAKKSLKFQDYAGRSHDLSIYRRDWVATQDPYDLQKVDKGKIKTTKGSERSNLIQMKK